MRIFILCLVLMFSESGSADSQVPKLLGRVNDYAKVLTIEENRSLELMLAEHEKTTTNQIVVLIVPTLGDDDIFSFSQAVYDSWKLGQKGKDNGALVVVIKDRLERGKSTRIHTGRGLEGALPDIVCRHIVVDEMKPLLLQGKYSEGLTVGVSSIFVKIGQEYSRDIRAESHINPAVVFIAIFIFVILFGIIMWFFAIAPDYRREERSREESMTRRQTSRSRSRAAESSRSSRRDINSSPDPVPAYRSSDTDSSDSSTEDSTPSFSGGGGESAGGGGGD